MKTQYYLQEARGGESREEEQFVFSFKDFFALATGRTWVDQNETGTCDELTAPEPVWTTARDWSV